MAKSPLPPRPSPLPAQLLPPSQLPPPLPNCIRPSSAASGSTVLSCAKYACTAGRRCSRAAAAAPAPAAAAGAMPGHHYHQRVPCGTCVCCVASMRHQAGNAVAVAGKGVPGLLGAYRKVAGEAAVAAAIGQ
eukprot:TRINITY_DN8306_c0_g1_i2.p3 TRINITY_DN8306_c0_g1~~TRINITY_DN8306_c0_g1_i2.p3  ORF type:complete len:132 (-),score=28.04 TRINITY_DN8306_c0_g1_i2:103-498(-)